MRKKNFTIDIPEPCHEKWSEMTPTDKGKHCAACQRNLIDYSKMTDRELLLSLENSTGKLCGRFNSQQLSREMVLESHFIYNTRWKAFGLLLSGLLSGGTLYGQGNLVLPEKPKTVQTAPNPNITPPASLSSNSQYVTGTVRDDHGYALPFATVMVKETSIGTTTDLDGHFNLKIPEGSRLLEVSYVGYETKLVHINTANIKELDIVLGEYGSGITMGVILFTPTHRHEKTPNLYDVLKGIFLERRSKVRDRKALKASNKKETVKKIKPRKKATASSINQAPTWDTKETFPLPPSPKWMLYVSPNPFDRQIDVTLLADEATDFHFVIYDELGREVYSKTESMLEGKNKVNLHLADTKIPSGSYFLSVFKGTKILETQLIMRFND